MSLQRQAFRAEVIGLCSAKIQQKVAQNQAEPGNEGNHAALTLQEIAGVLFAEGTLAPTAEEEKISKALETISSTLAEHQMDFYRFKAKCRELC